jgi:N-acetylglucosamine repressor
MQELAATVRQLVEENGLEAKDICGIAVGFDGIVEARSGAIYYPIHNEDWGCNILIRDILEEQLPEFENIWIDNSGRFGAYGRNLRNRNCSICLLRKIRWDV